jgi:hypothetical protein
MRTRGNSGILSTKGLDAQLKWMFVYWLGTVIPLAGLMIALQW